MPDNIVTSGTSLDELVREAGRQMTICNSCRYCEGFCAVYPAVERRNLFSTGDIMQLANLCHDCRACYDACMYTPPHEFALNPPEVLTRVRLASYRRYVWPSRVPRLLRGWPGLVSGMVLAAAVTILIACLTSGPSALISAPERAFSPYDVVPYPALLAIILIPAVFAVAVMCGAGRAYWREVGGRPAGARWTRSTARATWAALTLKNQRGGGAECFYPDDDQPSAGRRRWHAMVVGGFGLCLLSTVSAAILQDFIGSEPPYPLVSVPVISGTAGGVGLVVGCAGLLRLKSRSSLVTGVRQMTVKDYGLLTGLLFLALTGLATLLVRDTAAFPLVFVVHLAAVMLAIGYAPYSKFVHLLYRFLALVRDDMETGPR